MEKQTKSKQEVVKIASFERYYGRNYFKDVMKLLLNLFMGTVTVNGMKVKKFFSFNGNALGNVPYYRNADSNLLETNCNSAYAEMEYNDFKYFIYLVEDFNRNMRDSEYRITISFDDSIKIEEDISEVLKKKAVEVISELRNSVCIVEEFESYEGNIKIKTVNATDDINIDDIFLPEKIKDDIVRFIYTYNNFKSVKNSLRYILSGKPGLGKTEIMRAVINSCKGNGNIMLVKRIATFNQITELASNFNPSLICIDDVDLLMRDRESGSSTMLRGFLENLDGVLKNNIFILATTNDKKIVDIAASRPGRFDLIIDFPDLAKEYYLPLIKRCTKDKKIVSLFNDEILDEINNYEISGSFIVNFVKQLSIILNYKKELSQNDLKETFKRIYDGFYKSQIFNKEFGFSINEKEVI